MARPGILYSDVASAATALSEANTYPSIEAVRHRLGSGSNSTISRHLKVWREQRGDQQVALTQGLSESLLVTVNGLHQQLKAEAEHALQEQQAATQQLTAQWQARLTELENQYKQSIHTHQTLTSTLTECRTELATLQQTLKQTQEAFQEQAREKNLLLERLNDKIAEVARLDQQVSRTQDNLTHYREATRQEREREAKQHEQRLNSLMAEVHQYQQQYAQLHEQHAVLVTTMNHLEAEKEQFADTSLVQQKRLDELQQSLITEQIAHKQLQHVQQQQLAAATEQDHRYHDAQQAATQLHLTVENAQGRITELTTALKKAEEVLANTTQHNLFLTQEKTELAAQLAQCHPNNKSFVKEPNNGNF